MSAEKSKKIHDDVTVLSEKKGNGTLRREIWVDGYGKVIRYNLAHINITEFAGDNGRIVGYDNAHNYHLRHFYGKVQAVNFISFKQTEESFEKDFMEIMKELRSKK